MGFEEDNQQNIDSNKSPVEKFDQPQFLSAIQCPKCGSFQIIKRRIFISFFITILFLIIFLLLFELVVLLQFSKEGIVVSLIITFSFCILFITAWLGLVEVRRCKNCGHRFRSLYRTSHEENKVPFPWLFVFLNGIIILFICIGSREMTRHIIYRTYSFHILYILFGIFWAALSSVFPIALSLVYQAFMHLFLKKRIKNLYIWAILFLIPSILVGTDFFYYNMPKIRAAAILSYGRLAALPESASHVREYSWSSPFSGEWFLSFRATDDDIETFIDNSSSLKGQPCQSFSSEKMRIPFVDDLKTREEYHRSGHETFIPDTVPPWYREEIRGNGRLYEIPKEGQHNWGEVIVDDVNNIVYVNIIWS